MSTEQQPTEAAQPTGAEHFDALADAYECSTGGSTRAIARRVLQLEALHGLFAAPCDAVVLDNACGTAIVAEEIIARCRQSGGSDAAIPVIHAVDPVEKMVALSAAKFASLGVAGRCAAAVMPGETLRFADGTFSHSITNMGLMFYDDAAAGAREICRTLKPGGVAVVTTWARLGFMTDIFIPAQKKARPGAEINRLPIEPRWFDPVQVEECLRKDGGFAKVRVELHDAHYSAPTKDAFCDQLLGLFGAFYQAWPWTEEEKTAFRDAVREITPNVLVPCTHIDGSSGFGVPVSAIIAICER